MSIMTLYSLNFEDSPETKKPKYFEIKTPFFFKQKNHTLMAENVISGIKLNYK